MRPMRRSVLALVMTSAVLSAWTACLPELDALKGPRDAGGEDDAASIVTGGCGDGVIATLDDGGDAGESCDPGEALPAWCPECRIVCEGRLDEIGGHCYFALDAGVTFTEANAQCGARGAHVVTFASDDEARLVDELAGDGGSYWIGLVKSGALGAYAPSKAGEPGLPSEPDASCAGCYARGGAVAAAADDAGGDPQCIVATDGGWARAACDTTRLAVCEREPVGRRTFFCFPLQCATVAATAGRKRYLIDAIPRTAAEAKAQCEAYDGGALAMFDTREEREQVLAELARLPTAVTPITAWIGITTDDDGGAWRWDDGMPVAGGTRPLPWAEAQPAGAGGGRAFVRYDTNRYDSELALTEDGTGETLRASLCQRGVE